MRSLIEILSLTLSLYPLNFLLCACARQGGDDNEQHDNEACHYSQQDVLLSVIFINGLTRYLLEEK